MLLLYDIRSMYVIVLFVVYYCYARMNLCIKFLLNICYQFEYIFNNSGNLCNIIGPRYIYR